MQTDFHFNLVIISWFSLFARHHAWLFTVWEALALKQFSGTGLMGISLKPSGEVTLVESFA